MRIMVCYDGAKASKAALAEAKRYARQFGTETIIVTSKVSDDRFSEKKITEARQKLEQAKADFEQDGLACDIHLSIRGLDAGEDLVKFADENSIDQIMIGVKKRSQFGKLIMGSVAHYVILNATCPVLGVR